MSTAALAALLVTGIFAPGCEDPGIYGKTEPVIYGRVVVHRSIAGPPMNDPYADIWKDALTGVIYANDSAFAEDPLNFDSLIVAVKAIKAENYLYVRAVWDEGPVPEQRSYSVWPRPIVHVFEVDTISTDTLDTLADYWYRRRFKIDTLYDLSGVPYSVTRWYFQDHFMVMWDKGDNGAEAADCRSMCHAPTDTSVGGDRMYTTGGGHADVWHWQAATTDPALLAQDEYWSGTGREMDAFTEPIYDLNYDSLGSQPLYMHQDPAKISWPFLHAGMAAAFNPERVWKNADSIPGYIVHDNASGSIADVSCYSSFNLGTRTWTVVMRRALNTLNPDDADFSGIVSGDSIMVSVAFMNNSDSLHFGSRPFYIVFP